MRTCALWWRRPSASGSKARDRSSGVEQGGKAVEFAGAAEHVDLRVAPQHVQPVAFSHAAQHAQQHPLAGGLALAHDADAAVGLAFGVLAHRAGVEEHHLGGVGFFHEPVPQAQQLPAHQLGIELVHLATEGLEVDAWEGRGGVYGAPPCRPPVFAHSGPARR